jgi:hypothetical protein
MNIHASCHLSEDTEIEARSSASTHWVAIGALAIFGSPQKLLELRDAIDASLALRGPVSQIAA